MSTVHNAPRKKQILASRDGGARCRYCGVRLKLRRLTIDHVVPRSRGGSNALTNLVLACGPCNLAKGRQGGLMERIVVVYERVSTDRQDISRQAAQRRRASADHPGAEPRVIQDDGVSAYKVPIFDRPGGRALCDLIEAGRVSALYVDAQDRLSRGRQSEWWNFADLLVTAGTRLIIDGRELDLNDETDELRSAFDAMSARRESREKSHRTRGGIRTAASQGRWVVGEPPYGYRAVEQRLKVHEAEALIVRRIYDEYVGGVGINRIASRLNADGVRTRRGAKFSARSILAVLSSRTYLGEIVLKGETLARDAHAPIIDTDTFARSERLRDSRRSRARDGEGRPTKRHLLDGLLYCANGHRMLARRWGHSEYYACSRKHSYGDCACPDANRRAVDETLLHHYLLRHFDADSVREGLAASAASKSAEASSLAEAADREEQEAVAALARIRRDYMAGKIEADAWNEFRADLEEAQAASRAKAAQLRARVAELEAEAAQTDVEAELVARLNEITEAVRGDATNPEAVAQMRAALAATFSRIVYRPSADVPAGVTVVWGAAELAPVLRPDLLLHGCARAPSPPDRRGRRARRWRTPGPRAGGGLRPPRAALRAPRVRA